MSSPLNPYPKNPPPPPARWTAAARERVREAATRRGGTFVLEGRKTVTEALNRRGVVVREVWISTALPPEDASEIATAAHHRGAIVGRAVDGDLARVSETKTPQGVIAVADDTAWTAEDLVRGARGPLLLLDRVQDPGNVGAVLRVAAAFGASGVLIGEGTADPLGSKALRASAGTALAIPFARGATQDLLALIARAGIDVILLDSKGEPVWGQASRPRVFVLAVGSEGQGASPAVESAARLRVSIPISPSVESLNAAVAVGIAAAVLFRLPERSAPKGPSQRTEPARGTRGARRSP